MTRDRTTLLRRALLGNAVFSTISGVALLVAAGPLADLIGLADPLALYIVGLGLLPFAGALLLAARRSEIRPIEGMLASAGDASWVVGTAVLLAGWSHLFTAAGVVALVLVAGVVATFCTLQLLGVRRLASPTRSAPVAA